MIAQTQPCVLCPTCQGKKQVWRGKHLIPCLACQACGVVDHRRVCWHCGHWRSSCECQPGVHPEFRPARLVPRPRPAWLSLVPQMTSPMPESLIEEPEASEGVPPPIFGARLRLNSWQRTVWSQTTNRNILLLLALWTCAGASSREGCDER